jgi:2-methylcitrate dehydratase
VDEILTRFVDFSGKLTYRDLPSTVVSASKDRLLDSLGCAISAHQSKAARIGRLLASPAASKTIGGRILGSRKVVAADAAAFATTCMIRDLALIRQQM